MLVSPLTKTVATALPRGAGWQRPRVGSNLGQVGLALAAGLVTAYAVQRGSAFLLIAALAAVGSICLAVRYTELVLIAWFTAILIDGRWLVFHKFGPLYVTEMFLGVLVAAVAIRWLVGRSFPGETTTRTRSPVLLAGVVWLPSLFGLAFLTNAYNTTSGRNFALILYTLFAPLTALVVDLRRTYRLWFIATLVGSTIALGIVLAGHAGPRLVTDTGATRYASGTFLFAFGIAPIVLGAAARAGLVRPWIALLGALPFVVGLVFVNHRSAWLGFVFGLGVLFTRRISVPVVVGFLGVIAVVIVLVVALDSNGSSTIAQEIKRAETVGNANDATARWRLRFWERAMAKSLDSPVIGNGFNPYPEAIVPNEGSNVDLWPAPHNSFVGIGYRAGLLAMVSVIALLGLLVVRGFRLGHGSRDPAEKATLLALTSIVVFTGITAATNVILEAPQSGPLFWTAVGLLAVAVAEHEVRARSSSEAAELELAAAATAG
jgi:O-antigen ligase